VKNKLEILKKWFAESVPTNAHKATATLGEGENGVITITYNTLGTEGNDLELAVVVADGNSKPLAAAFANGVLTITLATDDNGAADVTKNTAALIATKVSTVSGFTATKSGTGETAISTATTENIAFTGGSYCTPSPIGGVWLYENNTYYYCSKPCGKLDTDAWQTVVFTTI
jgi:hypothetical protein